MKRPRWALILLACLLPLQTVAATLLQCHTLDNAMPQAEVHLSHMLVDSPDSSEDCHGEREHARADTDQPGASAASPEDTRTCLHCALDCQGVQTLSLDSAAKQFLPLPNHLITFLSPDVLAQWPNDPQRPPI